MKPRKKPIKILSRGDRQALRLLLPSDLERRFDATVEFFVRALKKALSSDDPDIVIRQALIDAREL